MRLLHLILDLLVLERLVAIELMMRLVVTLILGSDLVGVLLNRAPLRTMLMVVLLIIVLDVLMYGVHLLKLVRVSLRCKSMRYTILL